METGDDEFLLTQTASRNIYFCNQGHLILEKTFSGNSVSVNINVNYSQSICKGNYAVFWIQDATKRLIGAAFLSLKSHKWVIILGETPPRTPLQEMGNKLAMDVLRQQLPTIDIKLQELITNPDIQEIEDVLESSLVLEEEKQVENIKIYTVKPEHLIPILYQIVSASPTQLLQIAQYLTLSPQILSNWTNLRAQKLKQYKPENVEIQRAQYLSTKTPGRPQILETCSYLGEIFDRQYANCNQNTIDSDYNILLQNKNAEKFMEFLLRDVAGKSCFGGTISLAVSKIQRKGAIFEIDRKTECKSPIQLILIYLDYGNFDMSVSQDELRQMVEADRKDYRTRTKTEKVGHAMALLLNSTTNVAELFDSNGSDTWWIIPVSDALRPWLEEEGYTTFVTPELFCPNIQNIQTKIGRGVCLVLAMLYLTLRVHCPELESRLLIEGLLTAGSKFLERMLIQFLCYARTLLTS